MALTPGTRIGPYEIKSPLGEGGMGVVFRALDTKLQRDVALKLLPDHFADDADRLSRFQREAQVLASLNHPNIAQIYGVEESSNTRCIVMELVEGETLQERLKRGAVPIEEALRIAKQIAEALESAHEKGIVHRDLKPANVKVTPEEKVKVLDFGLAKAFQEQPQLNLPNSPTMMSVSIPGMIMGTVAYMSPEQAKGRVADRACDTWAFGCVLYELLAGKPAFNGDDATEILAAVVKTEPDWTRLPETTPPAIRTLLRRCLRKDRAQRLGDAGAARIEIEETLGAPTIEPTPQVHHRRTWLVAVFGAGALIVGIVVGAWLPKNRAAQIAPAVTRLTLTLPEGAELSGGPTPNAGIALSPDGRKLAYVATRGGVQQIYVRLLDSVESKSLSGTDGATSPFFSPDGESLGFIAAGKLKRISVSGGVPITLADAGTQGAAWGPNRTIILRGPGSGLLEIPESGGAARVIPDDKRASGPPAFPAFLPGGKAVLITTSTSDTVTADERIIQVLTLETGERKTVIQGGSYGRYLSSGHLVFLRSGVLMAVPFDLERLEITGTPVPVLENVRESTTGVGVFSCSLGGNCAYVGGGLEGSHRSVLLVNRTGASDSLSVPQQAYGSPHFSPAGDKISFWVERIKCDVAVYEIARGTLSLLTLEGDSHFPIWTPDGKRITYIALRGTAPGYEIFWRPADISGPEEQITHLAQKLGPITSLSWSPDGRVLAFADRGDIWLVSLDGDRQPRAFVQSKANESVPAFSPDGHWIAYVSDQSGRPQIYVEPFPGPGAKYTISTDGGTDPVWARTGRELFFRSGDQLMAVEVDSKSGFIATKPKPLFAHPYLRRFGRLDYDVSPDGQHFVMLKDDETASSSTEINVVLNWLEELKQRVPVK